MYSDEVSMERVPYVEYVHMSNINIITLFSRFTGATWKYALICLAELQFIPVNTPFHFQVSQFE